MMEIAEIAHHSTLALDRTLDAELESFTQLMAENKDRMVNYLTRLTGCRDRAEDLAQETFVRFYQQRQRYGGASYPVALLYRIATNLIRSEERRKQRFLRLVPLLRSNPKQGTSEEEQPGRALLVNEAQQQVSAAIARLDLCYRAPLVLREIEGLSYRDIAEALGTSEGTVKSRLHRGKEKLRQLLLPYWKGEG